MFTILVVVGVIVVGIVVSLAIVVPLIKLIED